MSSVGATQSSTASSAAPGTSHAPSGSILSATGGPASPPVGTVLNGVVAVQQAGGVAQIHLDNGGTIQVRTSFPLVTNGQVALQIVAAGAPAQFVLTSVDNHRVGRAPAPASAPTIDPGLGPAGAAGREAQAAPLPTFGPGRVVLATVVRIDPPVPGTAPGAPVSTANPTPAVAGTAPGPITAPGAGVVSVTAAGLSPGLPPGAPSVPYMGPVPGSATAPASVPTTGAAPGLGIPAAGAGAMPGTTTPPVPFAVGAQLQVRVLALAGSEPIAASAGGTVVPSTVGVTTPGGHTVVRTPYGILTLAAGPAPPQGTPVTLEFIGSARHATAPAPPRPAALSHEWPALREVLQALVQADAGQARALLQHVIPQPGPRLAATMMFLLAVLGGGNVREWLGESASRTLDAGGKGKLLQRLAGDFAQLQRLGHDATGEWRAFFIPIYDGALNQLRLFVHHRESSDDDGAGEQDTGERFVVEVDLSGLGALQLDGLVRKQRFDLILRSREPLSEQIRHDLTGIFTGATAAGGYGGTLTFQAMPAFPVAPIKALPIETTEVVV